MGLFGWWDYPLVVDWLYEFYHEGELVAAYLVAQAEKLEVRGIPTMVARKARSPPIYGSNGG